MWAKDWHLEASEIENFQIFMSSNKSVLTWVHYFILLKMMLKMLTTTSDSSRIDNNRSDKICIYNYILHSENFLD